MRFNVKALALTTGVLWALMFLFVGVVNLFRSGYGTSFLQIADSIYPGYHATGSLGDMIVGTLYSLVDGAIAGWVFGWLYNLLIGKRETPQAGD